MWMDILMFMFAQPERGRLDFPNPMNPKQTEAEAKQHRSKALARMCGCSEAEVEANLKQIIGYAVATEGDIATLYCRRMHRRWKQKRSKQEAGRIGGLRSKPKAKPAPSSSTSSSSSSSKDMEESSNEDSRGADAPQGVAIPMHDVKVVFEHHCRVMSNDGKPRTWRLTKGRVAKIRQRLKTYTAQELKAAATKLSQSAFHRGENDNSKEYCDPDFLYRSDEQIDKWLNFVSPDDAAQQAREKRMRDLVGHDYYDARHKADSEASDG
jgi:hypothetical protein